MPSDHGFGLNDDETGLPPAPESEEGNPEGAVQRGKAWARLFAGVDRELLTKRKLDDCLFTLVAEHHWNRGDEDRRIAEEGSDHVAILTGGAHAVQTDLGSLSR